MENENKKRSIENVVVILFGAGAVGTQLYLMAFILEGFTRFAQIGTTHENFLAAMIAVVVLMLFIITVLVASNFIVINYRERSKG